MPTELLNLKEKYEREVVPRLKQEFGLANNLAVPRPFKVVLNVGFGARNKDAAKAQEVALKTLERISGQKPVVTLARKSISNFKIREGMPVGAMVTMRGARMYDFLAKLVNIALPRVRDFRGLSAASIDSRGNLSIGFREHIVFPEIRSDEVEAIHGLEVAIATTPSSPLLGRRLFELLGFPFSQV
ncbi:MAG: 50S ribosomal protein L5 [Candidatus Kerfeldbacteria bacterium]|nr:50S ribosomal protein L5 [Candidatus Kerfeldbacteria bacterium]